MAPVLPFLPLITTGLGAITGIMKTIGAHGQGKKEEQAVEAAESARKTALDTVGAPGGNKAPLSSGVGSLGGVGSLSQGQQNLGVLGGLNSDTNTEDRVLDSLRKSKYGFGRPTTQPTSGV